MNAWTKAQLRLVVIALAVALGIVGLLAGCGGGGDGSTATEAGTEVAAADGGSDTTASTSCGPESGQPASGKPIKVGAIVGATGPADFSSASQSAQAFFDCLNESGGIQGRPVDYLVEDDNWDPETASRAARKLVEDDGVVAMVGSTSFVECHANADYYVQQEVLVVAGVGVPRECFHSRNIAPVNQGPRLSAIGVAQYAAEQGAESLACIANNIPNFGGWVCEGVEEWGKVAGVKVESFHGQPDASDAEAIALQAIGSGADAVVLVEAAPVMTAYLKVAEQQGSGGEDLPWYVSTSAYDVSFPGAVGPYWNDKLNAETELSELDSTSPDNTEWRSVMDEFAPDAPRDSFSQAGYLAAKIFADTAQSIEGEIDRATVTEALRGVSDFQTDLLCKPWYFGEADLHNANHTGRIVKMTGQGETGFETVKECFDIEDPDLVPILDAEEGS